VHFSLVLKKFHIHINYVQVYENLRWLYAIGIRIIIHFYSLHKIFVAKHKTSNINFFTISEWYHFLMCVIYVLSTYCDDKTVSNWMNVIDLFRLEEVRYFSPCFSLILSSQMFTFAILVSYVLVKMWNISRNIFFNMIP